MTDETPEVAVETPVVAAPQDTAETLAIVEPTHGLAHLEDEFKEWLASAEHEASAILAWVASKI